MDIKCHNPRYNRYVFGIFVGCLALSLAEALDVSTIIFRKFNIRNHTKYVLLAVAVGKFIGNIIYFAID